MKKFYGFYRAKVVDVEDPDEIQRVRVRAMIHSQATSKGKDDGIPDDELPWAEQASSIFGGFGENGAGISTVPEKDSWVWIFFEQGDFMRPVYFASVVGKDDKDDDADKDDVTVIVTKSGHKITINDKSGEEKIIIEDNAGSSITIDVTEGIIFTDQFGNYISMNKTGKMSVKNNTQDLKLILDDIQSLLQNNVTAGNWIGNLGAPVLYTMIGNDLPLAQLLKTKIAGLLE